MAVADGARVLRLTARLLAVKPALPRPMAIARRRDEVMVVRSFAVARSYYRWSSHALWPWMRDAEHANESE